MGLLLGNEAALFTGTQNTEQDEAVRLIEESYGRDRNRFSQGKREDRFLTQPAEVCEVAEQLGNEVDSYANSHCVERTKNRPIEIPT